MASGGPIGENATSQTVAELLPKLSDPDPDYRFMSLNDLRAVLVASNTMILVNDYNTGSRTVDGVLKCLEDTNGEVQNMAVQW
jgi:cullin-associated NEDD8-dissociated protein 1